jgi:hypothetical protein
MFNFKTKIEIKKMVIEVELFFLISYRRNEFDRYQM